ncbi:MAG: zinc ribbon domain-containing protein [Phycisphaerae bacterium]|jgi:hypothetical protein
MTTTPGMDDRDTDGGSYQPGGFCPHCGYAMDAGRCPECGRLVSARQLDTVPFARRQRRRRRRIVLAASLIALPLLAWYSWEGVVPSLWRWAPTSMAIGSFARGSWDAGVEVAERFVAGKLSQAEANAFFDAALRVEGPATLSMLGDDSAEWRLSIQLTQRLPDVARPGWSLHLTHWELRADNGVVAGEDDEVASWSTRASHVAFGLHGVERLPADRPMVVRFTLELHCSGMAYRGGAAPLHVWNLDVPATVPHPASTQP